MDITSGKPKNLPVLLVEDDSDDAVLVREMLEEASGADFALSHVERVSDARESLLESPPGCVLLDLSLPDAHRLEALTQLRAVAPDVPIVILSGLEDELLAVSAVQEGAQDYLVKGRVDSHLLGRSISYAIERKRAELELARQAMHDSLTGLPNRALFLDRLSQALARSKRSQSPVAVMFIDLDNFKVVNDSHGHAVGDSLLAAIGGRLRDVLRESDTAARFGGDEFTILCENVSDGYHAVQIAERTLNFVEAPFKLNDEKLFMTASIGIAVGGPELDDEPEALIRDADAAMHRAKEHGTYYELFDAAMRTRVAERSEAEHALREAVESEEFRLLYQPQVDLQSGAIVGMEALVRWERPGRGLVGPDEFLSVAEESGLIIPIGKWVLKEACRQADQWQAECPDGETLRIAVNLSGSELADPDLLGTVREALEDTEIDPSALCLEITESIDAEDLHARIDRIHALKALGVSLAIDDFVVGYASIGTLKRLEIDVLKVDRSLVAGLGHDNEDSAIVAGMISLGRSLGMSVVAGGVETPEQLSELRGAACEAAQGYYFCRPRPAADIGELLEQGATW